MINGNIEERVIQLNNPYERKEVEDFLKSQGLYLERDVEYTVALYSGDVIIGTGSFSGKVLKCIAVDPNFKGEGLSNKILSHLIYEEHQRGREHLFLFTKPENYQIFHDMGFYKIMEAPGVLLLENNPKGIVNFTEKLRENKVEGSKIGSIVMNCNPFTLGHRYLIETAASENDVLHIFVVWEDRSTFPSQVRYDLIREGTKDIKNVVIHKGGDYIISGATFPTYFIKEKENATVYHATLDLKIFGEYIAPALGINRRYVGEEPYCPVTRTYNETMKKVLPQYGIEVIEIQRLTLGERAISASRVRELLRNGDIDGVKPFVPKTTYDFLNSQEGQKIIEKIKSSYGRH